MPLPLAPPLPPQLAKPAKALPAGDGWSYEPKWDGFRVIAFVDGDETYLQSRAGKPLSRYFPEIRLPPGRYVLDGELVIGAGDVVGQSNFEALQQRVHPAQSRIDRLAAETPARLVAFDLLALEDQALLDEPFERRRALLDELDGIEATPRTADATAAAAWLKQLEGVIAKELGAPYRPGLRLGMVKVKQVRTIDAVVVGYRPGVEEGTVGSLILGAYAPSGTLEVVGHASGFTAKLKRELVGKLRPYETGERGAGDASRWSAGRELEWVSLRPELVVEVTYDHKSAGRIRHGARVLGFRDDKAAAECRIEALDAEG